jgi:hypothetical protein
MCVCMSVLHNTNNMWFCLLTLISQHMPSSSSSFVNIPVPDARLTPTKAKNGAESPNNNLLVARLRKSADRELVTLLRTLSTNSRRACSCTWEPTFRNTDCTADVLDSTSAPLGRMLNLTPSTTSLDLFWGLYARSNIRPFCNSRWTTARSDISYSCVECAQRDANPPTKIFTLISCFARLQSHHLKRYLPRPSKIVSYTPKLRPWSTSSVNIDDIDTPTKLSALCAAVYVVTY